MMSKTTKILLCSCLLLVSFVSPIVTTASDATQGIQPLLGEDSPADWWFAFKFNGKQFPGCAGDAQPACPFGGDVQHDDFGQSQQFVYASSINQKLTEGSVCLGDSDGASVTDPLGATFAEIYNGDYYYVVWNDQFYKEPPISGCSKSCSSPWGHAKGVVAWDDDGNGLVIQVTTPAWPGSGSKTHRRAVGGNTLGCVSLDDNIGVAQHFFSLKLDKNDLLQVLAALSNASVVTDVSLAQLVNNGGPADVQAAVKILGVKSQSTTVGNVTLSSGVQLISKPSNLHVPPWQMVSAVLGGIDLRVASWWTYPAIPSTDKDTKISCWSDSLGSPGAVAIATSGSWQGTDFSLKGGFGDQFNHSKFAVNDSGKPALAIFGDMNQQGALKPGGAYKSQKCSSSQNGRGGTFYVVRDATLAATVSDLISGETAPQ